jgi:2-dehydro-3-deoxyglucarate aldolase/4-hydroxy-2-oxoheptanedioate aldolase
MSTLKAALRAGDPVVGGWISIGHPAVAEITASLDFDFATVDTEHAAVGIESVENLVRAVDAAEGETDAVVRVPAADPVRIKRVLDTGPAGIMVPRVDDAADARAVVAASTYPPEGIRGTAAGRAADYGRSFAAYLDTADDDLVRILQVETERAVENAGEIAAVEGVDALFVGPADLSAALECPLEYDADRFREAVADVTAAAADRDTPVGIFVTDPDRMERWLSMGFDFAIVGFDAQFLIEGNRERIAAFEAAVED